MIPRIRSLLDIMQVIELYLFPSQMRVVINQVSLGPAARTYEEKMIALGMIRSELEKFGELCRKNQLRMTLISVEAMLSYVALQMTGAQIDFNALERGVQMVAKRLEDELSLRVYFGLEPQQAEMFQSPLKDWDSIIARFAKTRQNIEESSKCFALERYGAAVFHILLVAEYGVIGVAKLMGVAGDKPGWAALERLQKILKRSYLERSDLEKRHSKMLEDVVPLAFVVKGSWRHKLNHIDNQIVWEDTDFSPKVAEEIISATRGFMRKLAFDLQATEHS